MRHRLIGVVDGEPQKPRDGLARWNAALWLAATLILLAAVMVAEFTAAAGLLTGIGATLLFLAVATGAQEAKRIRAGASKKDLAGNAHFTLSLGAEVIALEPGKTWSQLDHYKWAVRGLIEEPQNFHVHPDGSVEIYAEKINTADPEGPTRLEQQINKRHTSTVAHKPAAATSPASATTSGKPHFRVKLDHWGHMVIEWGEGLDREETGLRGLPTLIANGLIRKPGTSHVDPLQRGIEIDGVFYPCSADGAKRLEEALNTRYAVARRTDKAAAIAVKENRAASAGFDIHFTTHRAGVPLEIKGHLSQENLDILQDTAKCDLLRHGIHLLLSPPYLLIRRRRPDMGEEKIPEVPDVNLLHCNAAQLQHTLNHPLIRAGASVSQTTRTADIVEMRVIRNPEDKMFLWLECVSGNGEKLPLKAFTHHNVAALQQSGLFRPKMDVRLSLDHRRLSIESRRTRQEETLTLDPRSPDEDLRQAGRMLTNALKTPEPRSMAVNEPVADAVAQEDNASAVVEPSPVAGPPGIASSQPTAKTTRPPQMTKAAAAEPAAEAVAPNPHIDPVFAQLFSETDAVRINLEIFRRLSQWLGITPQDVHLSLPFVFENRRFEILSFEPQEISEVAQLRGEDFYGFYLSHVSEQKLVLVYACNGMHIEWRPDKCVLQATAKSEAEEFKGNVLLGLAQNPANEFVFVVKPEFKKWIAPREKPFTEENLQFLTVADVAAAPENFKLIWPERPKSPQESAGV